MEEVVVSLERLLKCPFDFERLLKCPFDLGHTIDLLDTTVPSPSRPPLHRKPARTMNHG